eukprot:scaffold75562_cov33-Tisochrysis_lutea.AAC.2
MDSSCGSVGSRWIASAASSTFPAGVLMRTVPPAPTVRRSHARRFRSTVSRHCPGLAESSNAQIISAPVEI